MRDTKIIELRPDLDLDLAASNAVETFQNQTLRPVLKLQHELLVQIFKHYIVQRKNTFNGQSKIQKLEYIAHSVKNDLNFKNRLMGIVIGHFTISEYENYLANEAELARRLVNLLVQRLQSEANTL